MPTFYGPPSDGSVVPAALAGYLAPAVAHDGGETIAAKLDTGIGDAVLAVLGDSTGNADDEWARLTVNALATSHPDARVLYRLWDDTAQAYGAPVEIQAGDVPATGVVFRDTFTRTGDLYGSTPDIGGAWGGFSNSVGDWTMDGADAVRTEDATGSDLLAETGKQGDAEVRLSATINALARPSTKQFKTYLKYSDYQNCVYVLVTVYANGGTAWTLEERIANTITVLATGAAGDVTPNVEAAPLTLSVRLEGSTATATVNGTVRTATLSTATMTAIADTTTTGFIGSPAPAGTVGDKIHSYEVEALGAAEVEQTLDVYNGSMSGAKLDYQAARLSTMLPVAPDLVILSSCHNYGSALPGAYIDEVETFVEQVRDLHPDAGVAVSSQNPQKAPAIHAAAHAARLVALRPVALRRGWGYVPAFEYFRAQADNGDSLVAADGVHPVAAGSALWRDAAVRYFNGLALTP